MRSSFSRTGAAPGQSDSANRSEDHVGIWARPKQQNYLFHSRRCLDSDRLIALPLERRQDLLDVRPVARLDGHIESRPLGRDVEEQAVVIDLQNVDTELAEPCRDMPEHAG